MPPPNHGHLSIAGGFSGANTQPSGVTARRKQMTHVQTASAAQSQSKFLSIFFVAAFGIGIIVAAGHAQSATLHDAAHDTRHATGFPCH